MKLKIVHIIIFCCTVIASWSQDPKVILSVEPENPVVGEMITVTVQSNVEGDVKTNYPSAFVQGYNVMSGMEQEIDANTGKVITWYYLSQSGVINKEGTFNFGPFYIKKRNRTYTSNTVSITVSRKTAPIVGDFSPKQLKKPAFGIIERSKTTLYEGEPLVLNARVYSHFIPTEPRNYAPYELSGVLDVHELGQAKRTIVDRVTIKRHDLYTFEFDKKVLFPTGTGKFRIEPFKLVFVDGFESYELRSNSAEIEILPLPEGAPTDFIGAVGKFEIDQKTDVTAIKQGEVFLLEVEISGSGNLQNIQKPVVPLPKGMVIYGDPVVKEEVKYTANGAEGKVTYEYNIQVTKVGKKKVPEVTISYFDPEIEKYVQVKPTEVTLLTVKADPKYSKESSSIVESNDLALEQHLAPAHTFQSSGNSPAWISNPLYWLGFAIPLSLAFVPLVRRIKPKSNVGNTAKTSLLEVQEMNSAIEKAKEAMHNNQSAPFYSHIESALNIGLKLYTNDLSHANRMIRLDAANAKDENIGQRFRDAYAICDQARFGLSGNQEDQHLLLDSVITLQQELNK